MKNGWRLIKLGELCELNYGKALVAKARNFGNVPVYSSAGVIGVHNVPICETEGIIIGRKGSVGTVYYSPVPFFCIDTAFYIKPSEKYDLRFLYYLLTTLNLNKLNSDSAVPGLNRDNAYSQIFYLPPILKQKEISIFLSELDNKIELNEKINQNLEAQAQAIFKSWFVDFEPFGGKMPADWKTYKLGEFLPVITGKKNANVSSSKGKYPFFSCAQDTAWADEFSFDANAILVAGNGDFSVKFYNGKFEAYQRTYVLIPHNPSFTNWLYYVVKYNLERITSGARGSVIKFITKGNLEDFSFFAPRNLDKLTPIDFFNSTNNKIAENKLEILKLAQLRDALLPKLMSGEIDVSDVAV